MAITLLHGSHGVQSDKQSASEAAPPTAADRSACDDLLTRTSWTDAHVALVQIKKVIIHRPTRPTASFAYATAHLHTRLQFFHGETLAAQIIGCCVGDEDISRPLQVGQSPPQGTSHLIGRSKTSVFTGCRQRAPSISSSK